MTHHSSGVAPGVVAFTATPVRTIPTWSGRTQPGRLPVSYGVSYTEEPLSRLNRTHAHKEDTFVLDFVNHRDEIREAFATYHEGAEMGAEVDPSRMYAIKAELDASGVYLAEEVERFCSVYFKPRQRSAMTGPGISSQTMRLCATSARCVDHPPQTRVQRTDQAIQVISHPCNRRAKTPRRHRQPGVGAVFHARIQSLGRPAELVQLAKSSLNSPRSSSSDASISA